MSDTKKLNMVLAIAAAAILIVSFSALAYSLTPKGDSDVLVVNGVNYPWADIFNNFEMHNFTANEQEYAGISLADLLLDAGVQNPEAHTYKFVARDPYQQDVSWSDIQNGYLIESGYTPDDVHRAIFPEKTHSFWVYNLASIEVV